MAIRLKSIKDELRRNLKKSAKDLASNKRVQRKVEEANFMADFVTIAGSESCSYQNSQPSTPTDCSDLIAVEHPSTSSAITNIFSASDEEIPEYLVHMQTEQEIDLTQPGGTQDEEIQKIELPAWAKRICSPEELTRQQMIWDKVQQGRLEREKAQLQTIQHKADCVQTAAVDTQNFARKRKATEHNSLD